MNEIVAAEKNSNLENYTDEQKQTIAKTIKKKDGINLWLWLEELWRTIGVAEKKVTKNSKDPHMISEQLDHYDKMLGKKRSPGRD